MDMKKYLSLTGLTEYDALIKQEIVNAVQAAMDALEKLPEVTSSDDGKFLRVISGAWTAATIPNAEEDVF